MKLVDRKALDYVGYSHYEVVGTTCRYNGVDDDVDVVGLVGIVGTLMQEFLNNIREVMRQRLANLGMGVLARNETTHRNKLVKRDAVPIDDIGFYRLD